MALASNQRHERLTDAAAHPPPSGDNPIQNQSRFISDSLIRGVGGKMHNKRENGNARTSGLNLEHADRKA